MLSERLQLLRELDVSVVLDVGANAGQYASRLREDGYTGRIISFEPLGGAYAQLEAEAATDPGWETVNIAVGEIGKQSSINVSANSYSSSLLPITEACLDAAPDAAYVDTQIVDVVPLDALDLPEGRTLLKIDAQGYEPQVVRGADRLLRRVALVETEVSLVPLYAGQELAPEVCHLLRSKGFVPVAIDVAFSHPLTGEILQLDLLFRNQEIELAFVGDR